MKKKVKLVTHNFNFHADDVFAAATLIIFLKNKDIEIIRTRDEEKIISGDYVFDVGGVYNKSKNRFDHHQKNFKEKRKNGIFYSSFGLVWKKYGDKICNSKKIADEIDSIIVQPIDATDNGIKIYKPIYDNLYPYTISRIISTLNPIGAEEDDFDSLFFVAVNMVKHILEREIIKAKSNKKDEIILKKIYQKTKDKRIIILEKNYSWKNILNKYPEPIFVIKKHDDRWSVQTVVNNRHFFESRKDFPKNWAGKSGKELIKVTGVEDAIFCHKARFICLAKSKRGAVKLAQLALEF